MIRLLYVTFLFLIASFVDSNATIPYKRWEDYTAQEIDSLRERWTNSQLEEIRSSLSTGRFPPPFVEKLKVRNDNGERFYPTGGAYESVYDLRGVILYGLRVQDSKWVFLCLQGASFLGLEMSGVEMATVNLSGALMDQCKISHSDLSGVNMRFATLSSGILLDCNLMDADLERANLIKASLIQTKLWGANLSGTDLLSTKFETPCIDPPALASAKNAMYVFWGDSISPRYTIGEEAFIDSLIMNVLTLTNVNKEGLYLDLQTRYRNLGAIYRVMGSTEISYEFFMRENIVKTRSYFKNPYKPFIGTLRYLFLELPFGYGARPERLFLYVPSIILLFSIFYWVVAKLSKESIIKVVSILRNQKQASNWKSIYFIECCFFSFVNFSTFGIGINNADRWVNLFRFSPRKYEPMKWVRPIAGVQALIGLWVVGLIIKTITS